MPFALILSIPLGVGVWLADRPNDSEKYVWCNAQHEDDLDSDACYDDLMEDVTTFGEWKADNIVYVQ